MMSAPLLVVVPARVGSKRLPGKNFKTFAGEPLYRRALQQALSLSCPVKVLFSSDCDTTDIDLPEKVIFDKRSEELSGDHASSQDLACYLWQTYGQGCSGLLWLQPTSPLRTVQHIEEALKLWNGQGRVVSASEGGGKFLKFLDQNGILQKNEPGLAVALNGALFILAPSGLSESDWASGAKCYLMPAELSVDIDDETDWDRALKMWESQ